MDTQISTTFIKQIEAFLDRYYDKMPDKETWYGYTENSFGPHPTWLMDTPHGYWGGEATDQLPADHSDRLLTAITGLIAGAEKFVDIALLGLPSGRFLEAIIAGINKLNGKAITMRILGGHPYTVGNVLDTRGVANKINTGCPGNKLRLFVAAQCDMIGIYPGSWNHGKYVSVDGKKILFGGHNYIKGTYVHGPAADENDYNPIFDISIIMEGPLAGKAHLFSNALFKFVNKWNYYGGRIATHIHSLIGNEVGYINADMYELEKVPQGNTSPGPHKIPVLHVTQPGTGLLNDSKHPNPSASALLYALGNAKKTLCIVQQDIAGAGFDWDAEGEYRDKDVVGNIPFVSIFDPYPKLETKMRYFDVNKFNALVGNLVNNKNLEVRIVLSNNGATALNKDEHYHHDASPAAVYRAIGWFLVKRFGKKVEEAAGIIEKQVAIKTIGFRGYDEWKAGAKRKIGTHAKYWSVDDEVCYIGSHNMYPSTRYIMSAVRTAHLQEWGGIIGNKDVVAGIRGDYFEHIFNSGKKFPFIQDYLKNLKNPTRWP